MIKTILRSDYKFPGQRSVYHGKVRDVYNINDDYLLMIVSDRISAFDVVLPKGIPYKGQVLNQIASKFLDATSDIVPNWKIASPDPNVTFGHKCKPYPVEMIVRAYLTGSSWRTYKSGARSICGIPIPDGMKEHQKFDTPIITTLSFDLSTTTCDQANSEERAKTRIPERNTLKSCLCITEKIGNQYSYFRCGQLHLKYPLLRIYRR